MYTLLQTGVVALYVLLTGVCFLLMLALAGVYISWPTFYATMTGWTLFCSLSVYIGGPLQLFLHGRIRRPILEEETRLRACFAEVCRSAGCQKRSRLRIAESDRPEICICSTNIIAISRSLMDYLTDDELKGVLAHELGHLISGDLLISRAFSTANFLPRVARRSFLLVRRFTLRMTVLMMLVLFVVFLVKIKFVIPVIVVMIFLAIFSLLDRLFYWVQLALSRQCEYRQDAFAHRLGYGAGLRDALKKLARVGPQPVNVYFILMHSAHPVIYHRIRRLERLEGMRDE